MPPSGTVFEVLSMPPEVSVVMSVYNGGKLLEPTLGSILEQKACDLEFIVVDDGSTDESPAALHDWQRQDRRLRVVRQDNAGLTRALMRGCAEAQGIFVARQDVGDISLPGRLAHQATALRQHSDLSFVSCGTRFVGPSGEFLFEHFGTGRARNPIHILDARSGTKLSDGPSSHPSVMFRRDKYQEAGGYRAEFYFAQDKDLWYRLAAVGKFLMLDEVLLEARIDVRSLSTQNRRVQRKLHSLAAMSLQRRLAGNTDEDILAQARILSERGKAPPSATSVSRGYYFLGQCLKDNGQSGSAARYFRQAIGSNPGNLKAWVRLVALSMFERTRVLTR